MEHGPVLATRNRGKTREFRELLLEITDHLLDLHDLPSKKIDEYGSTFAQNALIKALCVAHEFQRAAIADDSGLEVDALGGAPGVYSARFAGKDATDAANNAHLIAALKSRDKAVRTARYVAEIALVLADDPWSGSIKAAHNLDVERLPQASIDQPGATGIWQAMEYQGSRYAVYRVRGECEGQIVDEPAGQGGFGYDPHFFVPEWGATMAEVSPKKKATISHRARAVHKLLKGLRAESGSG